MVEIQKKELQMRNVWLALIGGFAVFTLVVFFALLLWSVSKNQPLNIVLINQNGHLYDSQKDKKYKLVFFGFTSCPDVCPMALKNIDSMMVLLGKHAEDVQPIFITVDPDQDTPYVMKQYIASFYHRIIGLTGTHDKLEALQQSFTVYAQKVKSHEGHDNVQTPEHESYQMAHSSYIYLTDRNNILLDVYDHRVTPKSAVEKIEKHLQKKGS